MPRLGGQLRSQFTFLIGLAVVLLGPCPLNATTLSGTVQDRSGTQVNGARIILWKPGATKHIDTVSADGRYSFSGLDDGDYFMKAERSGMGLLYGALHLKSAERHEMNLVLVKNKAGTGLLIAAEDPNGTPRTSALPRAPASVNILHQVSPSTQSTTEALFKGVDVAAVIHTDGTIDNLVVLSAGNEEAAIATLAAVRQWRYSPTYLDGKPVEVATTIFVHFHPR